MVEATCNCEVGCTSDFYSPGESKRIVCQGKPSSSEEKYYGVAIRWYLKDVVERECRGKMPGCWRGSYRKRREGVPCPESRQRRLGQAGAHTWGFRFW